MNPVSSAHLEKFNEDWNKNQRKETFILKVVIRKQSRSRALNQHETSIKEAKLELYTVKALEKDGLKAKLETIEEIKCKGKKQRVEKEICRYILDMHIHKKFYLSPKNINRYSEEDFKLKFWSHIIEEFFSNSPFFLHWGDTVPDTFSALSTKPKIDLRILSSVSSKQPDYAIGEFAKVASSTKFYDDKLKAALTTKKHLNSLLNDNKNAVVPFFLIMGLELCLLTLTLVKPELYIIKEVATCQFPITKDAIKDNGIENVIKCLSKMKEFLNTLKRDQETNKISQVTNQICGITGGESATSSITDVKTKER